MNWKTEPFIFGAARGHAAVALLLVFAACTGQDFVDLPTAPTAPSAPPIAHSTPDEAALDFPALTGPGRVFSFSALTSQHIQEYAVGYTTASRYVLYDNGTFALQYSDTGFEWLGSYAQAGDAVELHWYANSSPPEGHPYPESWEPWEATASLVGGRLSVGYPTIMWLDGFLDALYVEPQD